MNCIDPRMLICHRSSGNVEEGERKPPNVTLDHIVNNLLSFLNQCVSLNRAKNDIEEKYNIKNEHGDCWSADDIKRAWGKTQIMKLKSSQRKHWAYVILLQVIKRRLYYEECKRKEAQSDLNKGGNSAQSCSEISLNNTPEQMEADTENVRWEAEGDHWLTDDNKKACGTEQSITENREDRSTPSDAELKMMTPPGSQKNTKSGASKQTKKQRSTYNRKGTNERKPLKKTTVYLSIPFTYMPSKILPSKHKLPNVRSHYKLIDRLPLGSCTDVRKRKSYVMSYNTETKNAQWVYEILNKSTLQNKCKEHMSFGKNEFKNKSYDQGHLAAAANHKWCQEAYNDTYLLSNMTPQLSLLNKGMWKELEDYCRDFVKDDSVRNVHVYTGPLYLMKEKESKNYVHVPNPSEMMFLGDKVIPTHFFKVVIVENEDGTVREPECYQMPNMNEEYKKKLKDNEEIGVQEEEEEDDDDEAEKAKTDKGLLNKFRTNIDDIENLSGLKFISNDILKTMDKKKSVKLMGENRNGELHSVDIEVRIIPSSSKK